MSITSQQLITFRLSLQEKKKQFDILRIANGVVSKKDALEILQAKALTINNSKDTQSEKASKSKGIIESAIEDVDKKSGDVLNAVKTYTDKIKVGYFGKKTRRV